MLARGARLGKYEIVASLGSGGMGDVYRALDPRLEREVAIKVIRSLSSNTDAQARLCIHVGPAQAEYLSHAIRALVIGQQRIAFVET